MGIVRRLAKTSLLALLARKYNVCLDSRADLPLALLRNCGEGCRFLGEINISKNVNIDRFTSINGPATRIAAMIHPVFIGSFCSIASSVVIQEYYHDHRRVTTYYISKNICNGDKLHDNISKGPIVIEDDVWIGSNSVVLSGVTIGRGSVVGAGSVVVKDIPPYSIAAGNPARVLRKRFDDSVIEVLEKSQWWTWSVEKLREYRDLFEEPLDELRIHTLHKLQRETSL